LKGFGAYNRFFYGLTRKLEKFEGFRSVQPFFYGLTRKLEDLVLFILVPYSGMSCSYSSLLVSLLFNPVFWDWNATILTPLFRLDIV
jgi:hypothetical protein